MAMKTFVSWKFALEAVMEASAEASELLNLAAEFSSAAFHQLPSIVTYVHNFSHTSINFQYFH